MLPRERRHHLEVQAKTTRIRMTLARMSLSFSREGPSWKTSRRAQHQPCLRRTPQTLPGFEPIRTRPTRETKGRNRRGTRTRRIGTFDRLWHARAASAWPLARSWGGCGAPGQGWESARDLGRPTGTDGDIALDLLMISWPVAPRECVARGFACWAQVGVLFSGALGLGGWTPLEESPRSSNLVWVGRPKMTQAGRTRRTLQELA